MNYVITPQSEDKKWCYKFRSWFRLPYPSYQDRDLVTCCKSSDFFLQWDNGVRKYRGCKRVPILLLVLTALRYLGRGWKFDDLEESTAVSTENICWFILQFIQCRSNKFYNEFVKTLNSED